ncbi:hypothetical protein [Steroidobacter cummioxidans]|uniref:hypothetical protein n=1 Tax=Steroidobacter cummioxidans TaxID=1803913 RepID=UPI0019D4C415
MQAPFNSQSLNRYSYTFNNPLSNVDPTGYACGSIMEIIDNQLSAVPQFCPYPDLPTFPTYDLGGTIGGPGYGGGAGEAGTTADSTVGGVNGAQWEPPMEEPLRGGFSDLLRQLNEWTSPPRYVTEDGREIPRVTGMPPLPGAIVRATSAASAQNIVNGVRLSGQLTVSEATSVFTTGGRLSQRAINGAIEIIPAGALGNPAIPAGFAKFTTETFKSPAGPFQVHFYMNPATREVFYGLDYKVIFNSGL